ncbi:MAG: class I SAM-dependent methyltransferase [Pyrinomonadaceae bacterium]
MKRYDGRVQEGSNWEVYGGTVGCGSLVLDVGAGSGFYSVEVARVVSERQLELLDLLSKMLRKAQQKLKANGCPMSDARLRTLW